MDRNETLLAAGKAVSSRNDIYGSAAESFGMTAEFWRLYLRQHTKIDITLTAEHVANMMMMLKMVRSIVNPAHADNMVDVCGYAALVNEINTKPGLSVQKPKPAPILDELDENMKQLAQKFAPKREGDK
jgi:hypothetical protein